MSCGQWSRGQVARRIFWTSSGCVGSLLLSNWACLFNTQPLPGTSSALSSITDKQLYDELERRGLPCEHVAGLAPRADAGSKTMALQQPLAEMSSLPTEVPQPPQRTADQSASKMLPERRSAGIDTTFAASIPPVGVQHRPSGSAQGASPRKPDAAETHTSPRGDKPTVVARLKLSSPAPQAQLPLFEPPRIFTASSTDALGRQRLWREGAELLGADRLQDLVQNSRRYVMQGSIFFGHVDDAGVPLVLDEQASDGYAIRGVQSTEGAVYVDIGGHVGIPVVFALRYHPKMRVVCVEPMPENYFYLRWNLLANGFGSDVGSRVVVLNKAISNQSGITIELNWIPSATTSSGSFKDKREFKDSVAHQVLTLSLRDVLEQYALWQNVAIMKLDCEGCEWSAVAALTDKEFKHLFSGHVIGEFHMVPECSRQGWRRISHWCDSKFALRACGGPRKTDCCLAFRRVCAGRSMFGSCVSLPQKLAFNGIFC